MGWGVPVGGSTLWSGGGGLACRGWGLAHHGVSPCEVWPEGGGVQPIMGCQPVWWGVWPVGGVVQSIMGYHHPVGSGLKEGGPAHHGVPACVVGGLAQWGAASVGGRACGLGPGLVHRVA